MTICNHDNTRTIGWKDSKPENYKKYYINRETGKKHSVSTFEVSICDDCGVLINDYEGKVMTEKDIINWVDALLTIRLDNIIWFVEKVE